MKTHENFCQCLKFNVKIISCDGLVDVDGYISCSTSHGNRNDIFETCVYLVHELSAFLLLCEMHSMHLFIIIMIFAFDVCYVLTFYDMETYLKQNQQIMVRIDGTEKRGVVETSPGGR